MSLHLNLILVFAVVFAVSLLLNWLASRRIKALKADLQASKAISEQQNEVIARVQTRQQISHDTYQLEPDELDQRLQQDFRD